MAMQDCPNCGSECVDTKWFRFGYRVFCPVCKFSGPDDMDAGLAIKKWDALPVYDELATFGEREDGY